MKCEKCSKEYEGSDTCPFCSTDQSGIPVLKALENKNEGKLKKMNPVIIILIAVVIIAIILAVAITKSKNRTQDAAVQNGVTEAEEEATAPEKESEAVPVTFSEDVSVSFEGISPDFEEELLEHSVNTTVTTAYKPEVVTSRAPTTQQPVTKPKVSTTAYMEETTVKTTTPASASANAYDKINAFFSGCYYFDGMMISGGEKTVLEMAMNGSDFHVFSELEGQDIAIMQLSGKTYLLNPDTKKYTEINAAVKKMMGVDDDTFSFRFNKIKFDAYAPFSVTQATYNGSAAVCYEYKNAQAHMEFYAVGNEIVQIVLYDKNAVAETVLQADEFTIGYPSDMLTFQGYSKTNMISFMSSMM